MNITGFAFISLDITGQRLEVELDLGHDKKIPLEIELTQVQLHAILETIVSNYKEKYKDRFEEK